MPDYGHMLQFGYFLSPDTNNPAGLLKTAQLIDELGYDFISVQDHPYQPTHFDAMALMAVILGQTQQVHGFHVVANLGLRPPAMLAKAAASLDQLTNGRFELGLGTGISGGLGPTMGGADRSVGENFQALTEAIKVIRAMWSGESEVSTQGKYYQLTQVHPGPIPAHKMNLWLGGQGPRVLRLIGQEADGWICPLMNYVPPVVATQMNTLIDEGARSANRSPSEIRRIYNIPGRFTASALAPARETDQTIMGPPEHWAQVLTNMVFNQGFTTFLFAGSSEPAALRTFIQEVAPRVRENVAARRAKQAKTV